MILRVSEQGSVLMLTGFLRKPLYRFARGEMKGHSGMSHWHEPKEKKASVSLFSCAPFWKCVFTPLTPHCIGEQKTGA